MCVILHFYEDYSSTRQENLVVHLLMSLTKQANYGRSSCELVAMMINCFVSKHIAKALFTLRMQQARSLGVV